MEHPLMNILREREEGNCIGIFSVCSSNKYVLEAAIRRAKEKNSVLLIEPTANQVNQYGGYSGRNPQEFVDFIREMAERINYDFGKIILGGDHLGPLPWKDDGEKVAMEEAKVLIQQFVLAGFSKIHIDTSMKMKDDKILSPETIARRGALLARVAEESFRELKEKEPNSIHPIYIIGSEVPEAGGTTEECDEIEITKVEDFRGTIETFRKAFKNEGIEDEWKYVVGVVIQPGVEFGNDFVRDYKSERTKGLREALNDYPNIVFEGHSTDYQFPERLRAMVEDGIAILKVGPALTLAMREALFSLVKIERELCPSEERSKLMECLNRVMISDKKHWEKYYKGNQEKIEFLMKYSLLDRARYYFEEESIDNSIKKLFSNLSGEKISLSLVNQFFPSLYKKVRGGEIKPDAKSLLIEKVSMVLDDYAHATREEKFKMDKY